MKDILKQTELDNLKKKRKGFIMKSRKDGIEIKCTKKFVELWIKHDFYVKEEKIIRLVG